SLYSHPPPPSYISTLSLHDALPIYQKDSGGEVVDVVTARNRGAREAGADRVAEHADEHQQEEDGHHHAADGHGRVAQGVPDVAADRKSTRLNSSHLVMSYAVFCLKK